MGTKLANIVAYAANIVCPASLCNALTACCAGFSSSCCIGLSGCLYAPNADLASLSGSETAAGIILAVFLFLLILSAFAYVLSICSVGETLMFIIFKKKSDDDNILEREDEDDLEEEVNDDFSMDADDDAGNVEESTANDENNDSADNETLAD